MKQRDYKGYADYLAHQAGKIRRPGLRAKLEARWTADVRRFSARFAELAGIVPAGRRAICLGARLGAEVQALRDLGYDAIGVDLVASPPLVIRGDMHDAPFPFGSCELVYTNSIDHVYDLSRFAIEVRRLLTRPGWLAVQLALGNFGTWESLRIDTVDEFTAALPGFRVIRRSTNGKPPPSTRIELLLEIE